MSDSENPAKGYLDMELLRFTTAGSVDDGKSTLIGRLLYDSKAIFEDQMEQLEMASERRGEEQVNLAFFPSKSSRRPFIVSSPLLTFTGFK